MLIVVLLYLFLHRVLFLLLRWVLLIFLCRVRFILLRRVLLILLLVEVVHLFWVLLLSQLPPESRCHLSSFIPRGWNFLQPTTPLVQFPPLSDFAEVAQVHDLEINKPEDMNLDSTYFIMLKRDLPTLFKIMIWLANRKVEVKDLSKFDDWFYVTSDPIVVRVYARSMVEERKKFKETLLHILQVTLAWHWLPMWIAWYYPKTRWMFFLWRFQRLFIIWALNYVGFSSLVWSGHISY
jgi:hypothetical protein